MLNASIVKKNLYAGDENMRTLLDLFNASFFKLGILHL